VAGLSAYFYHLLPAEVAVHFENGLPDGFLSQQSALVLALLPQILLAVVALALAFVVSRLVSRSWPEGTRTNPKTIVAVMGNMIALPQIIFGFAMADIFVYNAYQIHLPFLWIFAVVIMVAGGVIIGVAFARARRRERSEHKH
jgi:small-conductance mechanosensitive channel